MSRTRLPTVQRKQQIVLAALHIISTQGVHRLTAAEIAREVGISDGTIFRHFRSMDEIVEAAIDHLGMLLRSDIPPPEMPPLERLRTFFRQRLEQVRRNPAMIRLVFTDRLEEAAGASGAARVRRQVEESFAVVRECLEAARAQGLVAQDVSVEVLLWLVLGILRSASLANPLGATPGSVPGLPDHSDAVHSPSADELWQGVEALLRRSSTPS